VPGKKREKSTHKNNKLYEKKKKKIKDKKKKKKKRGKRKKKSFCFTILGSYTTSKKTPAYSEGNHVRKKTLNF